MNEQIDVTDQICAVALKNLFDKEYFSICEIDKLIKVRGLMVDKRIYERMNLLHCIHYSEMTKDVRDWLFVTVMQVIVNNDSDDAISKFRGCLDQHSLFYEKESWIQKLLK